MDQPLVTVVCLSYNHEDYIDECITSILDQTYQNIEVILVDDASNDNSAKTLHRYATDYKWKFINNTINQGNCRAFNKALAIAKGKYIIDLAADDVLFPLRIEKQVKDLERKTQDYAVGYSDAQYIDEKSNFFTKHSLKTNPPFPSGNIYQDIIERYFISPPTTMVNTEVLQNIGGYDENLSYEDWDYMIRISRNYKFSYLDECLTKKRFVKTSLSKNFQNKKSELMHSSTFEICKKIKSLNTTHAENTALRTRIKYEIKETFFSGDFILIPKYVQLLKTTGRIDISSYCYFLLSYLKPNFLKKLYFKYKHNKK